MILLFITEKSQVLSLLVRVRELVSAALEVIKVIWLDASEVGCELSLPSLFSFLTFSGLLLLALM